MTNTVTVLAESTGFSAVNTIWVLLGAALVFFMQAGFAMVETGFTRAKNAGNIIMKNLMDFCIGTPLFWLFGFGLMFGDGKFIGAYKGIADSTYASAAPDGVPFFAFLIFQTVFCATAATIVSGAMAERTKFISYCIYSAIISLLVYPIEAHWIWGGGWLADLGFHDFAGSTCVHMAGGVAAFVGAAILGPRIGKYDKNGKAKAIPGHSLTLGALGCFILWFCWFGFNGASTTSMEGDAIPLAGKVFVTTNLAAAVATITTMIFTWIKYKKPDVSMTLNASLAGLVAITAPCDTVSPVSAAIIGIVAGILVVVGVEFIDQVLKIDDPVGACGVHMLNGMWGTIAVGLFSDGTCGEKHDSAGDADHDGIAGPFRHGNDCAVAEGDGRFSLGFTAFTLLFRYGAAAKPKQRYQRNGSEGESGGSEEQRCCGVHALHLRHECESPNEGRQYEARHSANLFSLHDHPP